SPASASPVLAPETLASSLASAAARSCAGPHISRTSGRPCSAPGLTARPATPEPPPGATHSRPEVRTARPPRPHTTTGSPLALIRLRDGSQRRPVIHWQQLCLPAALRVLLPILLPI